MLNKIIYYSLHNRLVILVCALLLMIWGTYTAFNTDVDVEGLFDNIHTMFTGRPSSGFSVLEITYSIGIGIGVVFFFNHFGRRKITQDPTPMEVQMRLYEDDVDSTILEQERRKEKK